MSETNVTEAESGVYEDTSSNVFSFRGRISQRRFVVLTLLPYAFMALAALTAPRLTGIGLGGIVAIRIASLLASWISMATYAKRWHDLGDSGWWALLQAVPIVNLYVWFKLALTKGQPDDNKYGEPPENSHS